MSSYGCLLLFVSLRSGHVCRWSILFRVRIFRRWHCTLIYDNYTRTSVRYALITYCCAASSERNSSYQLCCSNGNRDSNTNATIVGRTHTIVRLQTRIRRKDGTENFGVSYLYLIWSSGTTFTAYCCFPGMSLLINLQRCTRSWLGKAWC